MSATRITIQQASELLECSIQNVHYLVKGRYRKNAKRKKIVYPILKDVKIVKRGSKLSSYLLSLEEVTNYLNKKGEEK
jgi:hypothetical protein